jgi:glucans biosynthesis protein C
VGEPAAPTGRLAFIDGLRVAALALLIPYHVGMFYVGWDWHVKSERLVRELEPLMLMFAPWRLGLLFFIAGVAAQHLWARHGARGTLRNRSRRLLLPLVFGMLVVVVPQAYLEVLHKAPALLPGDGGYLEFWAAYLQGGRYCRGTDCMVVPTWNHLWFLPYLWLYAVIAAFWASPRKPAATPAAADSLTTLALPAWCWWLLPAVPLIAARMALLPFFPVTHDLVRDFYNHAQYGFLFGLGWWVSAGRGAALWSQSLRWRHASLGASLVAGLMLAGYFAVYGNGQPPPLLRWVMRAVWGLFAWWAIFAACGWAQRVFDRERPGLVPASAAVFCVYILHQTVIVVLAPWLGAWRLPLPLEALVLVAAAFGLSLLVYVLVRPLPYVRELLGVTRP